MRSNQLRKTARRGFTLLEVIIAVTIVALLAALVVPRLTKFLSQAHEDKAVAEVNTLATQVRLYITTETTGRLDQAYRTATGCFTSSDQTSNCSVRFLRVTRALAW